MPLTIAYRPIVLPAGAAVTSGNAPRPYHARLRRSAPSLRATLSRPRHMRSGAVASLASLMALAALVFGGSTLPSSEARASAPRGLPFETAGENFPGSAFYYLEPGSGVVAGRPGVRVAQPENSGSFVSSAIARPIASAGTAQDRVRALQCLTTAIYYEAATEPEAGQRAVAQVVLNRVAHPQWPNSVCGVVFQGSERAGCQFSFACDGSMARAPARSWWLRAQAVAARALSGEVYAPVGLATYYHTGAVHPAWADRMSFVGMIGSHLFYRPPGAAGTPAAFGDRYFGGEPLPLPRSRVDQAPPVDPLLRHQAGPEPIAALPAAIPAAPAPVVDIAPKSGDIRPEYRNSGRWLVQPTSVTSASTDGVVKALKPLPRTER